MIFNVLLHPKTMCKVAYYFRSLPANLIKNLMNVHLLGCAFMLMSQTFSSLALMFPPTFLLFCSIECTRVYDEAFGTT